MLYNQYKQEYEYLKVRLLSFSEVDDNPIIKEKEYIELLLSEIEELKNKNAELNLELADYKNYDNLSLINKIRYKSIKGKK